MNSWQVGDVKISCVVEFKSTAAYDPERSVITDEATYRFEPGP